MEPQDGQAGPLTDVGALARALAGHAPPVLLDVRWRLGGPPGIETYRAGHLPRAVFVDLDADLAAEPGPAGRHPLPPAGRFQAAMRRAGVSNGNSVVVYDEADATAAARAWWLLRYFGHRDCQVLDGGFRAWVAAGGQLATGEGAAPGGGDFTARAGQMPVLDADAAAGLARQGHLLDARTRERYRGEKEPIDPVAGHIPRGGERAHHGECQRGRPVPACGGAARQVRDPGGGRCRDGGGLLRLRGHRGPRGTGARTGRHPRVALRRLLVQQGGRPGAPGGDRPGTRLARRIQVLRCASP